jgi:hypothetical protein
MKFESLRLISEYCQNDFFGSLNSDKLLVFLPSVNGKKVYPNYPRRSWANELSKKYNVLYLSDPYQPLPQYEEPMGSWFISPDGFLTLEVLAKKISLLAKEIETDDVVFYGSSMGGYAAIILASLLDGSKAIAECPQLYLKKHPGSRFICENVLNNEICIDSVEPLAFLKNGKSKHIRLVCSVLDRHYTQHVLPFIKELESMSEDVDISFMLQAYIYSSYKKGHVAMNREDARKVIDEVFSL